jgi:hypothetical protein
MNIHLKRWVIKKYQVSLYINPNQVALIYFDHQTIFLFIVYCYFFSSPVTMVRSVILVSAIALYLSLSAVEAQVKQDVSNESLQTLIKYLKDHPASQGKSCCLPLI